MDMDMIWIGYIHLYKTTPLYIKIKGKKFRPKLDNDKVTSADLFI
jgi:hypothetical protein